MKTASYFNRYIREVLSQGTNGHRHVTTPGSGQKQTDAGGVACL